ncbi:Monoglyceride lipase like protein [Argiope bruennichi]|uniref:Monoglyceride lipase like protein n=1 Tax=Argiope bruennichi TaxID=94029 RepID=A0A8T0FLX0_ARGBR|nr:Monoglyceride lipase like protein [Argiope bruennichi]
MMPMRVHLARFTNDRGQPIMTYRWVPRGRPRALVLMLHSIAEHSMLYDRVGQTLATKGFYVFAHDHAGHGISGGERGHINDITDLVSDARLHVAFIRQAFPNYPMFILGHSVGGLIAMLVSYVMEIQGLILISPYLVSTEESVPRDFLPILRELDLRNPRRHIERADFPLMAADESVVRVLRMDHLCYSGDWTARTICSLLDLSESALDYLWRITAPFIIMHGIKDKVCDMEGPVRVTEESSSSDSQMKDGRVVMASAFALQLKTTGTQERSVRSELTEEICERKLHIE